MNSMIITRDGASFFIGGKPYTIEKNHPNYDRIIDAARTECWGDIPNLADIHAAVNKVVKDTNIKDLRIENGSVIYKHITIPSDLGEYITNLVRDVMDLKPIVNFMDKLLQNPDHRVFQQLFGFISYGKNPITPEGNFLAYKRVREDFTSVHDSTVKNDVGTTVEMPREKCNNNPEETCSSGLHFCSKEYLSSFSGEKVIVLEISPTDVVSIPVDYNNTKGRACRYKVVGELSNGEIKRVLQNEDVLKVATVETKYDSPVGDGQILAESTDAETNKAFYELGYRDGRKKLKHSSQNAMYLQGYKHGIGKKKKLVF